VIKIFNIGYKFTKVKNNPTPAGFLVYVNTNMWCNFVSFGFIYVYVYWLIIYQWDINSIDIWKKCFFIQNHTTE